MQSFQQTLQQEYLALCNLIHAFSGVTLTIVGDLTLDEFVTGQTERISREAPVMILRYENTKQVPGGGANTIYNAACLGAKVFAVGKIGDDTQGQALLQALQHPRIDLSGVVQVKDFLTVTKTRIAAHSPQSVTQQIVRIDRKNQAQLPASYIALLVQKIKHCVAQSEVLICSDYMEGTFFSEVIAAALQSKIKVVDTQKQLTRFAGADWFTPNLPEAELEVGFSIQNETDLQRAGAILLTQTQANHVLITRGEAGMSLFSRNLHNFDYQHIPAFNRREVFDVTGAGDTVTATLAIALAAGATPWQAAVLGNLAASIVVRTFGTTSTNQEEMLKALHTYLQTG